MNSPSSPILVAYDGSPDANRALQWAAHLAGVRGDELSVCIARGDLYSLSRWADEWTQGLAQEWADRAVKELSESGTEPANIEILDGLPAEAIIERSQGTPLLVMGSRGRGRLAGAVLGSTSQHVVRHAKCPVAVVRDTKDEASSTVVVGVDGSDESLRALALGVDIAGALGHSVHALYCWDPQPLVNEGRHGELMELVFNELQQREDRIRAAVEAGSARGGVPAEFDVSRARPTRALTDASESASLVVVGSRGLGAFRELLLGSTSFGILTHARCPVLVAR